VAELLTTILLGTPTGHIQRKRPSHCSGAPVCDHGKAERETGMSSSRLRVSEIVALVVEIRAEEARKYNAATKEAPVEAE